jgi:hypothetical protein
LTAATHTIDIDFSAPEGGATSYIRSKDIVIWRVE